MTRGPAPKRWAHLTATVFATLTGGAAVSAILSNSPDMPIVGIVVPALVGATATGSIAWYTAQLKRGGLHAFTLSLGLAVVGGPILAALAIAIKALASGAGEEVVGAVVIAFAGIACGFFLTIPIGIALGAIVGGAVGLTRLTASEATAPVDNQRAMR